MTRPLERALCPYNPEDLPKKPNNKTKTIKTVEHKQNTSTPLYFPLFPYVDVQLMATTLRKVKEEL